MIQTNKPVALWILIITGLFALMELGGGFAICFSKDSVPETVDATAKGVDLLLQMWGSRQVALGVILAVAVLKRSVPMLTLSYIFLLVMFLADLMMGLSHNDLGMLISGAVMTAISLVMLYFVNRNSSNLPE